MKKLIFILSLFSIILLFSFAGNIHALHTSKEVVKKRGSCAAPTGLSATVNFSSMTLKWNAVPGITTYSYGGYYNRTGANPPGNVINFGGVTGGT